MKKETRAREKKNTEQKNQFQALNPESLINEATLSLT